MRCIVVSRFSALFQRLLLLDYQIGLKFASGVGFWNVGEMDIESAIARFSVLLRTKLMGMSLQTVHELCHIRRTYIHIQNSGRAWQPSPTRRFFACSTQANICHDRNPQICLVRADTAVSPYDGICDCDGQDRHLTFTWVRNTNTKVLLDTKANCHTHITDTREERLPIEGNSVAFLRHGIHL
jgi:hypothetical protein